MPGEPRGAVDAAPRGRAAAAEPQLSRRKTTSKASSCNAHGDGECRRAAFSRMMCLADDADLRIEIERQMTEDDRGERSGNANRQQQRHRNGPALLKSDQKEVRKQHSKTKDDPRWQVQVLPPQPNLTTVLVF